MSHVGKLAAGSQTVFDAVVASSWEMLQLLALRSVAIDFWQAAEG